MLQYKPQYYDAFHCLASRCPDTCCQEWDIQVDPETASLYASLPGEFGAQVRASLHEEEGETVITLTDNHCPMQRSDGLCRIQAELGEQSLCQVCRDFPRLHHDYGSFQELGLELSCPEAANILLTTPFSPAQVTELPGGEDPDYDEDAMATLLSTRKKVTELLSGSSRSPGETLILFFLYGCHAQQLLDGEDAPDFDPAAALETARIMAKPGNLTAVCSFFLNLEVLTPEWRELLSQARSAPLPGEALALCQYLVSRYWLQAVSDYDLYCRVKFMVICCILVSSLPGDFIWNAHIFSKEIENDIDNVDAILDAAYSDPIFTDDKLLGFLLGMF